MASSTDTNLQELKQLISDKFNELDNKIDRKFSELDKNCYSPNPLFPYLFYTKMKQPYLFKGGFEKTKYI
jgi:hypothetical protein